MNVRRENILTAHAMLIDARTPQPPWCWINPDATEADLLALVAFEQHDARDDMSHGRLYGIKREKRS